MCSVYIVMIFIYYFPSGYIIHNKMITLCILYLYISVTRDVILKNINSFYPWAQDEQSRCEVSGKNLNYFNKEKNPI